MGANGGSNVFKTAYRTIFGAYKYYVKQQHFKTSLELSYLLTELFIGITILSCAVKSQLFELFSR